MQQTLRVTAAAVIAAIVTAAPAAAQTPRERRAPDTDQTVKVAKGARLTINNHAGEVIIRTENRDTLRVMARHAGQQKVDIQETPAGVVIRSRGTPSSVDFEIVAPPWMPIKVTGTFNFVSVEGAQSEVSAETVRGDIVVKGGTGFVTAKSIEGEVVVEGARGRVNVSSVNEGIRITGASGDIVAETTNGDISMTKIESQSVEVSSVNGDILYEGSVAPNGRYRFATHNGDVTLGVPDNASATLSVRTYNGEFSNNLGLKIIGEVQRGRRQTYVMGSGAAEVELESFGGTIRVRRAGTLPPPKSTGPDRHEDAPESAQLEAKRSERARAAGACQPAASSVF